MRRRIGWALMGVGVRLLDLGSWVLDVGADLVRVEPPAGMRDRIMARLEEESNKRPRAADDWLNHWGDHGRR